MTYQVAKRHKVRRTSSGKTKEKKTLDGGLDLGIDRINC